MHAYTSMQLAYGSVYNASKSLRTHSPARMRDGEDVSANARAFADNRALPAPSDRQLLVRSGDEPQIFQFFDARGTPPTATSDGLDSKLDNNEYWIEGPVVLGDEDMAVGVVGATSYDTPNTGGAGGAAAIDRDPGMPGRRKQVVLGARPRSSDDSSVSLSVRQSMDVKLGGRGLERMISMRESESEVVRRDWAV